MKNYIISIGREFGSGGRKIAQLLTKELDIPCNDRHLIEEARTVAMAIAAAILFPTAAWAAQPQTQLQTQSQLQPQTQLAAEQQAGQQEFSPATTSGSTLTTPPAIGWNAIDGSYYHFKYDGTMSTGVMKDGETLYTFTPEKGNLAYARKEKNTGGGSFIIGFYDEFRQSLADNLNELKEDYFDGDEDDDYYEDEKVNYDKDASFVISGRLTEIAEHRLNMARTKGYGNGEIPGEGSLGTYIKSIRYNSGRRFLEVYLKACEDADDAEQKLLRSHGNDEKKRPDRAVYYSEMGIAHTNVDGKQYYMVILMK